MPKKKCPGFITVATYDISRFSIPWRSEVGMHAPGRRKTTVIKLYGILWMLAARHNKNFDCHLAHASYDTLQDIMSCTRNTLGLALTYLREQSYISAVSGGPGYAMSYALDKERLDRNSYFKVHMALFPYMNTVDAAVWSLIYYRVYAPKGDGVCRESIASMANNVGVLSGIVRKSIKYLLQNRLITHAGYTSRGKNMYMVNELLLPSLQDAETLERYRRELNTIMEMPVGYKAATPAEEMINIAENMWGTASM